MFEELDSIYFIIKAIILAQLKNISKFEKISSNLFRLICGIRIHSPLTPCAIQKCALEQVQIAAEQFGRSETKHFCIAQGVRGRLLFNLNTAAFLITGNPIFYDFFHSVFFKFCLVFFLLNLF